MNIIVLILSAILFISCDGGNSNDKYILSNDILTYEGEIDFHSSLNTSNKIYLYINPEIGDAQTIKVHNNKFSFSLIRPQQNGSFSIYAFYDKNNNKTLDWLQDKVAYVSNYNNQISDHDIKIKLLQVKGHIDNSKTIELNRFDFNSNNPPILQTQDNKFFKTCFQSINTDGSFEIYVNNKQKFNLLITHISPKIEDYSLEFDYHKYHQLSVSLINNYKVAQDIYLYDSDGESSIKLLPYTFTLDNRQNYPNNLIYLQVGEQQNPCLLVNDDNNIVSAENSNNSYTIYFRNYDPDIASDGFLEPTLYNELSNFSVQAFIDINNNFQLDKKDKKSNTLLQDSTKNNLIIFLDPIPSKQLETIDHNRRDI